MRTDRPGRGFLSIRWKFFAIVAAVVVLLGTLAILTGRTMATALRAEHDHKGAALAGSLATMAAEPMLVESDIGLALLLGDAKDSDREIVYAFVCDTRGAVVSHTFGETFPADLRAVARAAAGRAEATTFRTERGVITDFAAPVMGGTIGTLHLGISRAHIAQRIAEYRQRLILVTVMFLAIGLLLSHALGTYITRPLDEVVRAAEDLGGGNLGRRSRVTARDETGRLSAAFNRMADELQAYLRARQEAEESLHRAHEELERRVEERTAQLAAANAELESFSYSVSHDLRAPLRGIDGFSLALLEDYGGTLDATGEDYLRRIRGGCVRMGNLVDGLLQLSRLSRREMRREPVDLSELARGVAGELRDESPERRVDFVIAPDIRVEGDPTLLRAVVANLFRNSWKFTARQEKPRIEFGRVEREGTRICFVRDNGVGFDMRYADKLFGAFQRLHSTADFEGTGIGLATVKRVVHRHGGLVWAEAEVGKGATFYFTLGERPR